MPEHQNIEYKQTWRDEYLKWICGFANAQGGKIYIGIDDNGIVAGVELTDLADKGIFEKKGKGRSISYILKA